MDPYEQLRNEARQTRDKAYSRIRDQYRDSLRRIESLRAHLGGAPTAIGKPRKGKSVVEMVCDLMPRDKGFTFADIHRLLQEANPGREFNQASIRTILPKLEAQGMIRRVTKNQRGHVVWAAAGVVIKESPFGAMALTDVAESILRECGPMTPVQLVVVMREKGHRADADPRKLVATLRQAVRRYPGRFTVETDGRWKANADC